MALFTVKMGNNSETKVCGQRSTKMALYVNGTKKSCDLKIVLCVSDSKYSLTYVQILCNRSFGTVFKEENAGICKQGTFFLLKQNSLYLNIVDYVSAENALFANLSLWREHLGHMSREKVQEIARADSTKDFNISEKDQCNVCYTCSLSN